MDCFSSSSNHSSCYQNMIKKGESARAYKYYPHIFMAPSQPLRNLKPSPSSTNTDLLLSNLSHTTKKTQFSSLSTVLSFFHNLTIPSYEIPSSFSLLSSFVTTVCSTLINPALHPSVDPKFVLTGNFKPVDEMAPTECLAVEGHLPLSLNGVYIRNGPNPQHTPVGPHHLFEGDGMLHSIRLSSGRATFTSRYVKTNKYNLEEKAGIPVIPNFLSGFYGLADIHRAIITLQMVITGQINLMKGFGYANTSIAFFSGSLFALMEADLPYVIKLTQEGDIETIGRFDFVGKLFANMTAHPKIDPETKEIFAFRCFPVYPYLTFFRFDINGTKQQDVPIFSMKSPSYVHDFAITKNYAVFPDTQLEMALENLIACKGMPVRSRPDKVPRIGIISRYASTESEIRWFTVPGFNAIHITNAWEEEDNDSITIIAPNLLSPENFLHHLDKLHFSVEKLKINMTTGDVSRSLLSPRSLELGSINPTYVGKKSRFIYMGVCKQVPKMSGVVKIDTKLGLEVASRDYGPNCFGGELLFVPRDAESSDKCEEDDGYIVSYVHIEKRNESRFVVMDAKSLTLEIVASVKLPGRVPYGFHGLFVSEKDLKEQP